MESQMKHNVYFFYEYKFISFARCSLFTAVIRSHIFSFAGLELTSFRINVFVTYVFIINHFVMFTLSFSCCVHINLKHSYL